MAAQIENAPGRLTSTEVNAVEQRLGEKFPSDYREFLLRSNGGSPDPNIFEIQWTAGQTPAEDWVETELSFFFSIGLGGPNDLEEYNLVDFRGRIPKGTVAIADDPAGNLVLLAVDGPFTGRVLFWVKDHEVEEDETPGYKNVGFVAESFTDLIEQKLFE